MAFELDIQNLALVKNEDRLGKWFIHMIAALVARGWTVEGSGDGLAQVRNRTQTAGPYNVFTSGLGYYTGGGVWSASLGGANSITNTRAWFIIKEPAPSTRAFCFQRSSWGGSSGYECFITASMAPTGFATSGAAANAPPAANGALQHFIYGGTHNNVGSDYFGGTLVEIADAVTLIGNMLVSTTARAGNVWPFRFTVYNSTAALVRCGMVYEALIETVTGDPDPYIVKCDLWFDAFGSPGVAPSVAQAYQGRADSGTVSSLYFEYGAGAGGTYPNSGATANADGKIRPRPIFIVGPGGRYKGRCESLVYNYQARNYPSTLDLASANPYLYAGMFLLDWKTGVTPGT